MNLMLKLSMMSAWMLLLASSTLSQTLSESTTVFLDQTFTNDVNDEPVVVKVTRSQLAYLQLEGSGVVTAEVVRSQMKPTNTVVCSAFRGQNCLLWNYDDALFFPDEDIHVKIKLRLTNGNRPLIVKLVGGEFVEASYRPDLFVDMSGASNIDALISMKNMRETIPERNAKMQLFIFYGAQSKRAAKPHLQCYMKLGQERITLKNSQDTFEMETLGSGLVTTIIPSDPRWCIQRTCVYSVRCESQDISWLQFRVEVFNRESVIHVSSGTAVWDQLLANDNATYVLKDDRKNTDQDWYLVYEAVEGDADIYVHGDTLPSSTKDFHWKSELKGSESLTITQKEIKEHNFTGNVFYVFVTAKSPATFMYRMIRSAPNSSQVIRSGEQVRGELEPNEVVNYYFSVDPMFNEAFNAVLTLKALSGNPDLYLKACDTVDQKCTISEKEISRAEDLSKQENIYFRYSSGLNPEETIPIQVNCKVPGKASDIGLTNPNYFDSPSCGFAIAVVGQQSGIQRESKFILNIVRGYLHKLIGIGERKSFSLSSGQSMYFMVNVQNNLLGWDKQHLNFNILATSGDGNMYYSKFVPYPSKDKNDQAIRFDNPIEYVNSQIKSVTVEGSRSNLTGHHFVAITADSLIYGSFEVSVHTEGKDDHSAKEPRELKIGESLIDNLMSSNGSYNEYFFHLEVANQNKGIQITLNLYPLEGSFKFCIKEKSKSVGSWEGCRWKDVGARGSILIEDKDPNYVSIGDYAIRVEPNIASDIEEKYKNKQWSYSLSLSAQDTWIELQPGITINKVFPSETVKFKTSVVSDRMVIMLTSNDANARLDVSFLPHGLGQKGIEGTYSMQGRNAAIDLKRDLVLVNGTKPELGSNLYIEVVPSKANSYIYSVLVFVPESPVKVTPGVPVDLPLPISGHLHLGATLPNNETVVANVYSENVRLQVEGTLKERDRASNDNIKKYLSSSLGATLIQIDKDDTKSLHFPYLKLQVTNEYAKEAPKPETLPDYDLTSRVQIQISTSIRRLSNLIPLEVKMLPKGSFSFFRLSKLSGTVGALYLTVKSGEADIYARRGDEFPTLESFDLRSNSIKSDELALPATGNSNNIEDWAIAVFAREKASFTLIASKNSNMQIHPMDMNQMYSIEIGRGKHTIFTFRPRNLTKDSRYPYLGVRINMSVEMKQRIFDEQSSIDFLEELPQDTDDAMSLSNYGYFQRIPLVDGSIPEDRRQYVFSFSSFANAKITLFVGDQTTPVNIRLGEEISERVNGQQCNQYRIDYGGEIINEILSLNVEAGQIQVWLMKGDENKDSTFYERTFASGSFNNLELGKLLAAWWESSKTEKPFFDIIRVQICTEIEGSIYRLFAKRPSQTMIPILPGSRFDLKMSNNLTAELPYFHVDLEKIKKLQVKIELGQASSNVQGVDLLEFDFVSEDDFGFYEKKEGGFPLKTIPASLENKEQFSVGGSNYLLLTFRVQHGYFIIRPKPGTESPGKYQLQLLTNSAFPLSPTGTSTIILQPASSIKLQYTIPDDSYLDLKISACKGGAEVKLERDPTTVTVSEASEDYFARRYKGPLIEVDLKNSLPDSKSFIALQSDITKGEHGPTLKEYFESGVEDEDEESENNHRDYFSIEPNEISFEVDIYPMNPSKGIQARLHPYERAKVEYILLVGKEQGWSNRKLNSTNICLLSQEEAISEESLMLYQEELEVPIEDGVLKWPDTKGMFRDLKYPKVPGPYRGFLQTKLILIGPYSTGQDDDAVLVFKSQFDILKPDPALVSPVKIAILACLIAALVYISLKIKKRLHHGDNENMGQHSNELGHVRVSEFGSSPSNKIQNVDESSSTANQLDRIDDDNLNNTSGNDTI